jgi:hypothetical protein
MKSLKKYIIESIILEGGNAIKTSTPVPAEYSLEIYNDIKNEVMKVLPDVNMIALGSTGKKNAGQTHGDIDIAINLPWDEKDKIENIFKENEKFITSGMKIVSVGYPWKKGGKEGVAQCDFMFFTNLKYAEMYFHSPDYRNNESLYKGKFRTLLFNDTIANIPTGKANEYFQDENKTIKEKWKYTLNSSGLFLQKISYEGKNGTILKSGKKIKEAEQLISDTPKEILDFMFKNGKESDLNSVESIWKAIHSNRFKFPEVIDKIEEQFKGDLERDGIEWDIFLKNMNLK